MQHCSRIKIIFLNLKQKKQKNQLPQHLSYLSPEPQGQRSSSSSTTSSELISSGISGIYLTPSVRHTYTQFIVTELFKICGIKTLKEQIMKKSPTDKYIKKSQFLEI